MQVTPTRIEQRVVLRQQSFRAFSEQFISTSCAPSAGPLSPHLAQLPLLMITHPRDLTRAASLLRTALVIVLLFALLFFVFTISRRFVSGAREPSALWLRSVGTARDMQMRDALFVCFESGVSFCAPEVASTRWKKESIKEYRLGTSPCVRVSSLGWSAHVTFVTSRHSPYAFLSVPFFSFRESIGVLLEGLTCSPVLSSTSNIVFFLPFLYLIRCSLKICLGSIRKVHKVSNWLASCDI